MARAQAAFRLAFGVMLLGFFCMPIFGWKLPEVPPHAMEFRNALIDSGYVFPVIYAVYLCVGLAYVTNLFVPLATIVLFPITFNIVLYHVFLVPAKLPVTAIIVVPHAVMIAICWRAYGPLFTARFRRQWRHVQSGPRE